ncbi:hypothetical protein TRFO_39717 [Tritrichomonas foetus]|uniref:Uncharacterized protein n=1 Tax=Tritrichomonas foetus TaxID=1144522 RepID=A0A1J4J3P7_9EUKA|nr:hypothetical protein TRFO_39717 [Tritrichomonas foetus]|eukprot:OHS94080.1 hypothetical protein TRFO_39717 [Tritrichomonas foetus]
MSKQSKVSKVSKVSKRSKSPKKLSKKERARLKREAAEQERLEQERKEREEQEQREREYEKKKREEQQQRLAIEDGEIKKLRESRTEEGRRIRAEQSQAEDWQIFTQCDHSIDTRSAADVNSFITMWSEHNDDDMKQFFEKVAESRKIVKQLSEIMEKAEVAQDSVQYDRCHEQIEHIKNIIDKKIEQITMHHLVFSDKFAGAKNEVQINSTIDGLSFGMWVNLSKNPRNKEITFPGVKVEIPKAVAMTSIAIRMIISEDLPFNENYLFLNNLLKCEFLVLPVPPKHVTTMTLRQSPKVNTLSRIEYPLKNITGAQPPLNFTIALKPGLIHEYNKDATIVAIKEDGTTATEPITKVNIDTENNEIQFSSMTIGSFALAVPRYNQFPLQNWELNSISETSYEIYLKTATNLELTILINSSGKCSMTSPFEFTDLSPVSAIEFLQERGINIVAPKQIEGINPKTEDLEEVLALGIADAGTGYNVHWSKWNSMLPPDRAMLIMRENKEFTRDEEEDILEEEEKQEEPLEIIAPPEEPPKTPRRKSSRSKSPRSKSPRNSPSKQSQRSKSPSKQSQRSKSPSKQSPKKGASKAQSRAAVEAEMPPPPSEKPKRKRKKDAYHAILVKANHIIEVPNTEYDEECILKPRGEEEIHSHLLPMFFNGTITSAEVKDRVKGCPSFLVDSVLYYMKQLRLFSMTK